MTWSVSLKSCMMAACSTYKTLDSLSFTHSGRYNHSSFPSDQCSKNKPTGTYSNKRQTVHDEDLTELKAAVRTVSPACRCGSDVKKVLARPPSHLSAQHHHRDDVINQIFIDIDMISFRELFFATHAVY